MVDSLVFRIASTYENMDIIQYNITNPLGRIFTKAIIIVGIGAYGGLLLVSINQITKMVKYCLTAGWEDDKNISKYDILKATISTIFILASYSFIRTKK